MSLTALQAGGRRFNPCSAYQRLGERKPYLVSPGMMLNGKEASFSLS